MELELELEGVAEGVEGDLMGCMSGVVEAELQETSIFNYQLQIS